MNKLSPATATQSNAQSALKNQLALINELEVKIAPIQSKLATIDKANSDIESAKTALAAANSKLDELQGRRWLGEKVDSALAELELKDATELLSQLTASSQGATAAKGMLQNQLDTLHSELRVLALQVKPMQYAAMRDLITPMAENYKALTVQVKDAYIELVGACQSLDDFGANPAEGIYPLAYSYIPELDFPSVNIDELKNFKSHWVVQYEQIPYKSRFMQSVREAGIL